MPPSNPTIDQALPHVFRRLRLGRQETQEEVAISAGLTLSAYGRIELAQANPTWSTVLRLAEALDISLIELAKAVERERR